MKLSIRILADWLKDDVSNVLCKNNRMEIESLRLYSPSAKKEKGILYIGTENDFFNNDRKNIAARHENDYIYFKSANLISIVNRIQDAWCFYSCWYNKCTNAISNGGTLNDLLTLSEELFPTPVVVVDAAQTFVAVSSPKASFQNSDEWKTAQERGSVSEESLRKFNLAHPDMYTTTHVFPVDPEYFFVKGYCRHLFINGARRASVILKDPDEKYTKGDLQLFEVFTDFIREWILSLGETSTSFKVNSYLARALEGDERAIPSMLRQTELFGWSENCSKVLFVIAPLQEGVTFDTNLVNNLTHEAAGVYAMIHNNNVVILSNSDIVDHSEFNTTLHAILNRKPCYGAVSFSFTDMKMIAQGYQLALTTLESNPKVAGALYHSQNSSLRRIAKILNEQASFTLLHPALSVIKDYDEKNKTEYYATLFCYLKNERRHSQTSEELFIHRNTLFQRLQKIQDIWPLNLDDPDERFHLLFSFYQEKFSS